jgi:transcriptional regulator with XRE-family HTH domain
MASYRTIRYDAGMTVTQIAPQGVDLAAHVARRVRGLMGEHQVRQTDLAKMLGVSQSAASDRLRGVTDFPINELPVLAAEFSTSIEYLLGLTDDRSPGQGIPAGASSVRHQGLEPRTR